MEVTPSDQEAYGEIMRLFHAATRAELRSHENLYRYWKRYLFAEEAPRQAAHQEMEELRGSLYAWAKDVYAGLPDDASRGVFAKHLETYSSELVKLGHRAWNTLEQSHALGVMKEAMDAALDKPKQFKPNSSRGC